jgi:hypothetical protein
LAGTVTGTVTGTAAESAAGGKPSGPFAVDAVAVEIAPTAEVGTFT